MSAIIGFHGGAYYHVQEDYENIRGRDWTQPFEVTLLDGHYAPMGQVKRLFVNPPSVAYVEERGE